MAEHTRSSTRRASAKDDAPQTDATAKDAAGQDEDEQKFAIDDLTARSTDFLGQPSHVVAAALYGRSQAITLDKARELIDEWLSQPVIETDDEDPEEA